MTGWVLYRPYGAVSFFVLIPGLAPWATILRSFRALRGLDLSPAFQCLSRRWWVLGIFMSARYLATVRRLTLTP